MNEYNARIKCGLHVLSSNTSLFERYAREMWEFYCTTRFQLK
jgi:hypothetical protein